MNEQNPMWTFKFFLFYLERFIITIVGKKKEVLLDRLLLDFMKYAYVSITGLET